MAKSYCDKCKRELLMEFTNQGKGKYCWWCFEALTNKTKEVQHEDDKLKISK